MKFNKLFLVSALALVLFGQAYCQMTILSGPEKGSYNRFAGDIVKVLGEKNGIRLINQVSGGSADNFKKLTDPASADKIALIQSDYLTLMETDDKLNNTNLSNSLKVVIELAGEEIHLVAKKSSGLKSLRDLNQKKVAIGDGNQGSFAAGKIIGERSKINWIPRLVGYNQVLNQLSANNIDAFLLVGSAPVDILDIDPKTTVMNDLNLIELENINGWANFYEYDTIFRTEYKWLDRDIPTFGVRTLLIVNESKLTDAEKQTVAAIKSGIIQNLDVLRALGHPKWKEVIIPDEPVLFTESNETISKTTKPVTSESKDAVLYRVQIYSRNYRHEGDEVSINDKTYKTYVYYYLSAFRYTIGEFTSLSDAADLQKMARKSGYKQAFVAAFKNNVRDPDPDHFK
jgi:TRAP transporter TAXI family solute receptor